MIAFGRWVQGKLGELDFSKTHLARAVNRSRSYITKVTSGKLRPPLETVKRIGAFLGDVVTAMKLAKYPLTGRELTTAGAAFAPLETLIEWLCTEQVYSPKQAAFLSECLRRSIVGYSEAVSTRTSFTQALSQDLTKEIRRFVKGKDVRDTLQPICELIIKFRGKQENPSFMLERISLDRDILLVAIMTGLFDIAPQGRSLELKCPVSLIPFVLLRPTGSPSVNNELAEAFWTHNREAFLRVGVSRGDVEEFYKNCYRNFQRIPERGKLAFWSLAKHVAENIWNALDIKMQFLLSATDYYDAKVVYMRRNSDVYVFSMSSGLVVPHEHYGSVLPPKLGGFPTDSAKNPNRQSYFKFGIEHGCNTGCRVFYQWDEAKTASELKRGLSISPNSREYQDEAERILAHYLQLENIEICESRFDRHAPGVSKDWRQWVTLSGPRYVLLSARDPETKKLIHGVLMQVDFLNEILEQADPSLQPLPRLSRKLYLGNSKRKPIKAMGEILSEEEALSRAKQIVKRLASRTH